MDVETTGNQTALRSAAQRSTAQRSTAQPSLAQPSHCTTHAVLVLSVCDLTASCCMSHHGLPDCIDCTSDWCLPHGYHCCLPHKHCFPDVLMQDLVSDRSVFDQAAFCNPSDFQATRNQALRVRVIDKIVPDVISKTSSRFS